MIPKVQPLLKAEAINSDPRGNLLAAIAANSTLLSQFESMQATDFLKAEKPDVIRQHAIDLLYGSDPLLTRLKRFRDWSRIRSIGGKKVGMNPTAISYLLAMSNPKQYAFCKPSVFTDAEAHLLKSPPKVTLIERLIRTTELYKAALYQFQTRYGLPFTDLQHVHIAFWVMHNPSEGLPGWEGLPAANGGPGHDTELGTGGGFKMATKPDLNLILYGPPGTGKTYDTIRRAVQICDGEIPSNHQLTVARFHQLRKENRLAFVTFHQSYGYEDFVEGLRPVLQENESSSKTNTTSDVRYECRPGVFKRLCTFAESHPKTRSGGKVDWDNVTFWKMSLGNTLDPDDASIYEQCLANNYLLLGYGEELNFEGCDSSQSILQKFKSSAPTVLVQREVDESVGWR